MDLTTESAAAVYPREDAGSRFRLASIRLSLPVLFAAMAVLAMACGGDDEGGSEGANGGPASDQGGRDAGFDDDSLDVDACSLLTDEEVSTWLGMDLVATGHNPVLGCGYDFPGRQPPDGVPEAPMGVPAGGGGMLGVRTFIGDGDAATAAADLRQVVNPVNPHSAVITELPGGDDDAVVVSSSGGAVHFVVARRGDLFVEFNMTVLLLGVDSPELAQAAEMTARALDRLESAV